MNSSPDLRKKCYRCPNPAAELHNDQQYTCCDSCRAKLDVEANYAGATIPALPRLRRPKHFPEVKPNPEPTTSSP